MILQKKIVDYAKTNLGMLSNTNISFSEWTIKYFRHHKINIVISVIVAMKDHIAIKLCGKANTVSR